MASTSTLPFQAPSGHLSGWSDAEKLGEAMRRSLPRLGPSARRQIEALLTLEALAIIAGVLVVWIGAHFFGIGFIADAVLLIAGLVAIGTVVFEGLDHLYQFASKALGARQHADLDIAARHFASAITILGIEAVLVLLFRGAPRTFRGREISIGPTPPTSGLRYRPGLRASRDPWTFRQPPGTPPANLVGLGVTRAFGEIRIYRPRLSDFPGHAADMVRNETRMAAYHEAVHRALTPKLNLLWRFRVRGRSVSYDRSSLSRYLEEALAETVAQVGVNGFRSAFRGVSFPVTNGYVTLLRRQGNLGSPIMMEVGGLLAGSFILHGMSFDIFLTDHPVELDEGSE